MGSLLPADDKPVHNRVAMYPRIIASAATLANFCQKWKIREVGLFGSVLRDDYCDDSDIDMIVDFEPDCTPGLAFFTMEAELSELLGRPVDVVTRHSVERSENTIRRNEVLNSVEVIYAHG